GHGDQRRCGDIEATAYAIPGHTLGAIAYRVGDDLFTGDTLFLAGCGRVFEGTMSMMAASLRSIRELPGHLRLHPGHDYTERNLEFAATVDSNNQTIVDRLADVRRRRERGNPVRSW